MFSKHHFDLKGKRAERVVQELAFNTFLVDWCFPNPKWQNGKEICDLLVVFDSITIICQIKDLKLKNDKKYNRNKVEKNLSQLSGARRKLLELKAPVEIENTRREPERFKPDEIQEVYLISVLMGEAEEYFSFVEEFKDHTIHVFTRDFIQLVLEELDTLSDFTAYLREKEKLLARANSVVISGGEEELLALYLGHNRSFDNVDSNHGIFLTNGIWEEFRTQPKYLAKKKEDEISYCWDRIINRVHEGSSKYELVARELARTNRFERRILGKAFFEASQLADADTENDLLRTIVVAEKVNYCFLFVNNGESRETRKEMLAALSWVVRGKYKNSEKVIGIANNKNYALPESFDYIVLSSPNWSNEDQNLADEFSARFGFFRNPTACETIETEYPTIDEC